MELGDIQGLALSGYARQPVARYFFLRFEGGDARGFVGAILNRVSSAAAAERDEPRRLNVAFSATGLRGLGLSPPVLARFPREFVEGMADPERARRLGDLGPDAPERWELGGSDRTRLDALVLSYATTPDELDDETERLEEAFERHGIEATSEDAFLPPDGREHFGNAFTRTNPRLSRFSLRRDPNPFDPRVFAGEFVLGYKNARRERARGVEVPLKQSTRELPPLVGGRRGMDLGRNGSYLAFRKLEQDVPGFLRFLEDQGPLAFPGDEAPGSRLLASIVGRWPNGTPLVLAPDREPHDPDPSNAFGYRDMDPKGRRCPLGAHVRRANPRDGLGEDGAASLERMRSVRLLRRGRLYGPRFDPKAPTSEPRGLFFLALCANLAGQFEFVQESLLENPKLDGLHGERDPLVGRPDQDGSEHLSIQAEPYARRIPLQRFVRVRGGAYLFLPGMKALGYLAEP